MCSPEANGTPRESIAPLVLEVSAGSALTSPALARLIAEVRAQADAFIFLSGGASKMSDQSRRLLLELVVGCLTRLVERGLRIAVGDGGTKAGVMEAAGEARRATRRAFPLVGVAPAPQVTAVGEPGKTAIDPNHLAVVTVENQDWRRSGLAAGEPADDYWGSEIGTMFEIFGRLAEGKASVALVANGGRVTLDEVRANIDAGRATVVVAGSGRAADALVSLLGRGEPADDEGRELKARAQELSLGSRPELYHLFDLAKGPEALADTLAEILRSRGGPVD